MNSLKWKFVGRDTVGLRKNTHIFFFLFQWKLFNISKLTCPIQYTSFSGRGWILLVDYPHTIHSSSQNLLIAFENVDASYNRFVCLSYSDEVFRGVFFSLKGKINMVKKNQLLNNFLIAQTLICHRIFGNPCFSTPNII